MRVFRYIAVLALALFLAATLASEEGAKPRFELQIEQSTGWIPFLSSISSSGMRFYRYSDYDFPSFSYRIRPLFACGPKDFLGAELSGGVYTRKTDEDVDVIRVGLAYAHELGRFLGNRFDLDAVLGIAVPQLAGFGPSATVGITVSRNIGSRFSIGLRLSGTAMAKVPSESDRPWYCYESIDLGLVLTWKP